VITPQRDYETMIEKNRTSTRATRPTVALLTNVVAPYRVPIYNALGKRFHLHVLYSGRENNREDWALAERGLSGVAAKRVGGVTLKYFGARSGCAIDERFLSINPGYIADLVRLSPEVVISVELGFRTLCGLLYSVLARVPLIVWWEGTPYTERDVGAVRKAVRRFIAPKAAGWISGSVSATAYLRSLGVDECRIVGAQNCVDEQRFSAASSVRRKNLGPRPVVLVVSRLVPGKGLNGLLDVVAQLKAEGRHFSLVIVGDGPERRRLQRRARELALEDVYFHLARPESEMPAYYRGADLLVHPTLHDVWGMVVCEALWSGLPVLASRYAGCATELLPAGQIFDPLVRSDFLSKLRKAIDCGMTAPDTSGLVPLARVAERIGDSIDRVLHSRGRIQLGLQEE
jgi:glycosyltransferase involved in cell wall biosynthesis